jgi:hypothetical protein
MCGSVTRAPSGAEAGVKCPKCKRILVRWGTLLFPRRDTLWRCARCERVYNESELRRRM